jgi:fibro-slime domain-containing protein
VIPVAMRSCSDDCGSGEQSCVAEAWQACVVPVAQRDCSSICGSGHETCTNGKWGACDAPQPKPPVLHTTIRDFHSTYSDFELPRAPDRVDPGMVEQVIGADRTPVYAGMPNTPSTPSGKAGFDAWYHDTPGVNLTTPYDLQLTADPKMPGSYFYEDRTFFPIDDQLFGNEGFSHNFHFTLETHAQFVYRGGEVFTFAGDDDVWVFIADQLVIDLGGTHSIRTASVSLDQARGKLGLIVGQKYPLDLFFAERHTIDSDFIVHTTIADVGSCQ